MSGTVNNPNQYVRPAVELPRDHGEGLENVIDRLVQQFQPNMW